LKKELFGNKKIKDLLNLNTNLEILEILPYGGQYTNLIARQGNHKISIAEYSKNNFNYIHSRIASQGLGRISYLNINERGNILNKKKSFNLIYCLQSLEEYPKPNLLITEIKNICNGDEYIVISIRNIFSWYGIQFYLKSIRQQVPNFGPHLPINIFKSLFYIKNNFDIIQTYGISPLPNFPGIKINFPLLKYFCRLLVVVCKKRAT